ncbi:hypothetical protein BDZ91DRAFT_710652 [Kalaharituber pfeilii]|nr:hypothetical protein BDZ91DRAFT_710652 [Kalaharituber pfeilii]
MDKLYQYTFKGDRNLSLRIFYPDKVQIRFRQFNQVQTQIFHIWLSYTYWGKIACVLAMDGLSREPGSKRFTLLL